MLRQAFRHWNAGDFEATTGLMHADVEWRTSGRFPDLAPVYHGREGVASFWRDFTAPWEEIVLEPLRFEVAGDVAVVDTRFRARGRDGIEVDLTIFNRFVRRDDLTYLAESHLIREEAVAAANVDIVRAAFSGWGGAADVDSAFDAGFHPEVEYREDPDWPGATTYRGVEEVRACFREYAEVLGFHDSHVERVVDAGDQVVAVVRVEARPAGASESVAHRWGYVCRVREGKVSFFRAYLDPARAFQDAGIPEAAS